MNDRPLLQQVPLFVVVGACATLTHVAVALAARSWPAAGYLLAVGVSYLGNARLTFRRRAMHGAQLARFIAVSLLGLALTQSLTWLLVGRLGWLFIGALGVVAVAVPALSFILARAWAFRAGH